MERVVLVTGGTGALGTAITRRFLGEGAVVCVPWIVEHERERLEASVQGAARPRLVLERCDVADDAAMARLAESLTARHRRIDVLVSARSEEHTSELQSHLNLVCRLLLEKKK